MLTTTKAGLAAIALLAAVAVAGCSSSGSDSSQADKGAAHAEQEAADPEADPSGDPAAGDPDSDRAVVYTADMTVVATQPAKVADSAGELVTGESGYVSGDVRDIDSDNATVTLTLRVPAASFHDVLEALSELGDKEISRDVSAVDVQQEVTDIDSLIESKKASVERVRDLMADASDLDDIVSIEAELTTREGELAALEAQKRSLSDDVSYSTVTLSIMTPAATPEPVEKGPDGFGEGLVVGWHGFVAVLGVLVTLLGVLLPFLIALAIPAAAVWWYLRRRRAVRPAVAGGAGPVVTVPAASAADKSDAEAARPPAGSLRKPRPLPRDED